ncbi:hypothetical protein KDI_27530 [Dictyobacter arantiisoli]|uniref:Uncharacterized protein n=1 Tax=Dictyobacter arantiisoli TaxID=2014874 RepID=A0A5A5TDW6_9CHLR|nr:hypothetical protein KDI_27530 [Dictyobacter arantiisoli]
MDALDEAEFWVHLKGHGDLLQRAHLKRGHADVSLLQKDPFYNPVKRTLYTIPDFSPPGTTYL